MIELLRFSTSFKLHWCCSPISQCRYKSSSTTYGVKCHSFFCRFSFSIRWEEEKDPTQRFTFDVPNRENSSNKINLFHEISMKSILMRIDSVLTLFIIIVSHKPIEHFLHSFCQKKISSQSDRFEYFLNVIGRMSTWRVVDRFAFLSSFSTGVAAYLFAFLCLSLPEGQIGEQYHIIVDDIDVVYGVVFLFSSLSSTDLIDFFFSSRSRR